VGLVLAFLWAGESSASVRVELVTIEPGDAVWERFGHNALRVRQGSRDIVYGYGYYPMPDYAAVWRYGMGRADFAVRVEPFASLVARYDKADRSVTVQPLDLSDGAVARLLELLRESALPENRWYRYEQLEENCSTRLRDYLDEVTDGALRAAVEADSPKRYRDFTLEASAGNLPAQLGLDLITGPNHERRANGWARLYLPEQLRDAVARSDFGSKPEIVSVSRGEPVVQGSKWLGRRIVVGAGVTLALLLMAAARLPSPQLVRAASGALVISAVGCAAAGTVVWLLVADSEMADFGTNWNALVFVPFDLVLLGPALRGLRAGRLTLAPWQRGYLLARLALVAGAVFAPQDNAPFVLLAACVLIGAAVQPKRMPRAQIANTSIANATVQ
jgi:hypothetical protein